MESNGAEILDHTSMVYTSYSTVVVLQHYDDIIAEKIALFVACSLSLLLCRRYVSAFASLLAART